MLDWVPAFGDPGSGNQQKSGLKNVRNLEEKYEVAGGENKYKYW